MDIFTYGECDSENIPWISQYVYLQYCFSRNILIQLNTTYYFICINPHKNQGLSHCNITVIQAAADITGQLQVRPMLYTLYIDINVRVVKMLHTDNKQQITKWIQRPSKRRSYVTPGGALQLSCCISPISLHLLRTNIAIFREKWKNLQTTKQTKNKEQTIRRFKDWDHSILCGYSRELANKRFNNWVHSNPLWILSGYSRELANNGGEFHS